MKTVCLKILQVEALNLAQRKCLGNCLDEFVTLPDEGDVRLELTDKAQAHQLAELLKDFNGDWGIVPYSSPSYKLLICDMDSTMIAMETLDYMADQIGAGNEIAAITEQAMQGKLDFAESLNKRLQCLKGQVAGPLFATTIAHMKQKIHQGARELITHIKTNNGKAFLVSGGFNFAAEALADELGFDGYAANKLEVDREGNLTGRITGPMVDRAFKAQFLQKQANALGIPLESTIAVGDGANDLDMIELAGLGVGFMPKPAVAIKSDIIIRSGNLAKILTFIEDQ